MANWIHGSLLLIWLFVPATALAQSDQMAEPPDGSVELRLSVDAPLHYQVRTNLGLRYDDHPHLTPQYQSEMRLEYQRLDAAARDGLPHWSIPLDDGDHRDSKPDPIRVTSRDFSASFDAPASLQAPASQYQLLADATLSYRLSDRGSISDIRVHPPTNPLLRANIEELIRLLTTSHPALPEDPIDVGETWHNTIELELQDEHVEQHQTAELSYHFSKWIPCDDRWCAQIDVEQHIEASGHYVSGTLHTETEATANGEGQLIFDVDRHRVLRSHWNTSARGQTRTERRVDAARDETVNFEYELDHEISFRHVAPH